MQSTAIPPTMPAAGPTKPRLASIDALRGLVMLLLISHSLGLVPFLKGDHPVMQPVAKFFRHASESYGWLSQQQTVWDMIMPTFMFVMGASMCLSGKCQVSETNRPRTILLRAVKRSAILYILGNIIYGVQTHRVHFDVFGVLPQIANIYLLTTLILLLPKKTQVAAVLGLLAGYLCLYQWVFPPADFMVPGPYAQYAEKHNIGSYIDKVLFHETYPWVFIAVIPFSALTTLGYWCGAAVKGDRTTARKLTQFVAGGLAAVAIGWLLSLWTPLQRDLMTTSFTIFSAGIVLLTFALLHWIMDIQGYKAWAFPLVVIGANAIVIYFIMALTASPLPEATLSLPNTTLIFTKPIVDALGPEGFGAMFNYWVCTLLYFLLSLWLYRNKLFIRV